MGAGRRRCRRDSLLEVLDREDDVPDAPNAKPIEKARGGIGFRDVSFGYSRDRLILRDINLSIALGKALPSSGDRRRQEHLAEPGPALLRSNLRRCLHRWPQPA